MEDKLSKHGVLQDLVETHPPMKAEEVHKSAASSDKANTGVDIKRYRWISPRAHVAKELLFGKPETKKQLVCSGQHASLLSHYGESHE